MLKQIFYFLGFTLFLFVIHKFILVPQLQILATIPVSYQHILLGGFSLLIYLVAFFMSENYFDKAGFAILGFLLLKMIFIFIFINAYTTEISQSPILKYTFVGFYFAYLIFLLLKIVPLINIDPTQKSNK